MMPNGSRHVRAQRNSAQQSHLKSEGKADRQAGEAKEKVGKVEEKVEEVIDKAKGVLHPK
jgi:ribosomal protein S20